MGLSGEDELQPAVLARDPPQALHVVEDQIGPFVGCGAAREAERQHVDVEPGVELPVHELEELAFGRLMGSPDFVVWNAQGITQAEVVLLPAGNVAVEQLAERWRSPGRNVNTVGDRVDPVLREHVTRDLTVLLGHAVDVVAEGERQVGHVEALLVADRIVDAAGLPVAQHLIHQLEGELVVAGRDRGVGGEDTLLMDGLEILGRDVVSPLLLAELA